MGRKKPNLWAWRWQARTLRMSRASAARDLDREKTKSRGWAFVGVRVGGESQKSRLRSPQQSREVTILRSFRGKPRARRLQQKKRNFFQTKKRKHATTTTTTTAAAEAQQCAVGLALCDALRSEASLCRHRSAPGRRHGPSDPVAAHPASRTRGDGCRAPPQSVACRRAFCVHQQFLTLSLRPSAAQHRVN